MDTKPNQVTTSKPASEKTLALLEQIAAQGKAELDALHEMRAVLELLGRKLEMMAANTQQNTDYAMSNTQQIAGLCGAVRTLAEAATSPTSPTPAAAMPAAANGNGSEAGSYKDFDAETIVVGMDDSGKLTYKIKGGQFTQFGVRVWPEVLPLIGVKAEELKPGPNQFNAKVRVLLGEHTDSETGEKKLTAKKVIGLAK